jgi:hypothetical protein
LTAPKLEGQTSFESVITKWFYVDKTLAIRAVIDLMTSDSELNSLKRRDPILITAPRRFGKTTLIEMYECFFAGTIPLVNFTNLLIGKDKKACEWFGKFTVVNISFGFCTDSISSREECIDACRLILQEAFTKYEYLLDHIPKKSIEAFQDWLDKKKYKDKDENDVLNGLRLLLNCAQYLGKPIMLCIDEFDKICGESIYAAGDNLTSIVKFYCNMVAQAVKHQPLCKVAILTGVTAVTSRGLSSFNNYDWFKFLDNEPFHTFLGVTKEEFKDLTEREEMHEIPQNELKLAFEWYNGYTYKSCQLYNFYSVIKFIEFKTVGFYWRRSGLAEGIAHAVQEDGLRKVIQRLLNGETTEINYQELHPSNFSCMKDTCYKFSEINFIFNFLTQQGYFTIVRKINPELIEIKIPNYEVRIDFQNMLFKFYEKICVFDRLLIEKCCSRFINLNMSNDDKVKEDLTIVKQALLKMLKKKESMNERWFESFLFSVFLQNAEIEVQEKVSGTAGKKKDRRFEKVLDTFIVTQDKCILFEESLKLSGQDALAKIIEKKYYKRAQEKGLPFVLIGLGVGKFVEGNRDITMSFLLNKVKGVGVNV